MNAKRLNYLKKVLAVQEDYTSHKEEGITNKYVFKKFIAPKYFIGITTMYLYLNINAKREIKLIEKHLGEKNNPVENIL